MHEVTSDIKQMDQLLLLSNLHVLLNHELGAVQIQLDTFRVTGSELLPVHGGVTGSSSAPKTLVNRFRDDKVERKTRLMY